MRIAAQKPPGPLASRLHGRDALRAHGGSGFRLKIWMEGRGESRFARPGFFAHASSGPLLGFCGPDRRREHRWDATGALCRLTGGQHPRTRPGDPERPDFPPGTSSVPRVIGGNEGILAWDDVGGDKWDRFANSHSIQRPRRNYPSTLLQATKDLDSRCPEESNSKVFATTSLEHLSVDTMISMATGR